MTTDWPDTSAAYNADPQDYFQRYEDYAASCEIMHGVSQPFMPPVGAWLLDVGAGSGRDAAYFRAKGYNIVAAEPAASLLDLARAKHGTANITWLHDSLPDLAQVKALARAFDVVLLSAVWMHVPVAARAATFATLLSLLKPDGILTMRVRHGPQPEGRQMFEVTEAEMLGAYDLAELVAHESRADILGRGDVSWTYWVYRKV